MNGFDAVQQHVAGSAANWGDVAEMLIRLLLSAGAGGLVGLEREVRGRQAGFRTNLLVCVGACLAMIVSIQFAAYPWTPQRQGVNINVDPARIAYAVMSGVGFLGAGTIIHYAGSVRGLTTAAAMWCVAAIGLAAGFGLYVISLMATVLVVAALWLLDYVEDQLPKVRYRTVNVRTRWGAGTIQRAVDFFKSRGLDVTDVSFKRTDDLSAADISLVIGFRRREQYYECERELEKSPDYEFMGTREN